MAIAKERVIGLVEVLEDGTIQIRHSTYLVEDGARAALIGYERSVVTPDMPVTDLPPGKLRAIAGAAWTPDVVAAYRAKAAARK